jgi:hypothetical protein
MNLKFIGANGASRLAPKQAGAISRMRRQIGNMKALRYCLLLGMLAILPFPTLALSRSIDRDIEFPKGYDTNMATAIRRVIQDEQFKFVGGLVSYWPPDWGTRLSFEGDAESLNSFLTKVRAIKGIGMRLILYKGRDDEARRDSDWQLDFSHARPNQLTIYLNLNARHLDFYKVKLPEWKAES